ncbi:MAG: toprim domain-containing protein [Methermicoccaceae archaeon]
MRLECKNRRTTRAEDERIRLLFEKLDELKELSDNKIPILVEGIKDVTSLKHLGITGPVIRLGVGSLLNFSENLAREYSEIVILTDWDRRGDELSQKLSTYLRIAGVSTNTRIRGSFKQLARRDVKDVEGLSSLFERLHAGSRPQ